MQSEIKAIFDQECPNLSADEVLARRIDSYVVGFINRNPDHSEFFGGNLTGVHIVRFTDTDKNKWFDTILEGDEESMRERIHVLPVVQNSNGVFHVGGDPMNLSCAWLLNKFYTNSKMSVKDRHKAMTDVLLVLQFKFLTSRLTRHFKYPADRATAEATYAALTNKYSIKVYGSWIGVLRARCEDILSNVGIHFNAISKMDNDKEVVDMVADIQGRLRDMLKNIYGVHIAVKEKGSKIKSTSSVVEYDGVEVLRDRTKGLAVYSRYLNTVIADKNSLIRQELLNVIFDIAPSAPPKHVEATLEYISANFLRSKAGEIEKMVNQVMIHSFGYIAANKSLANSQVDLAQLLTRLRGVYSSSRSTDPDLLELRQVTESVVRRAIQTRTDAVVAAVRTAVLLYLVARAYTMRHYTSVA